MSLDNVADCCPWSGSANCPEQRGRGLEASYGAPTRMQAKGRSIGRFHDLCRRSDRRPHTVRAASTREAPRTRTVAIKPNSGGGRADYNTIDKIYFPLCVLTRVRDENPLGR